MKKDVDDELSFLSIMIILLFGMIVSAIVIYFAIYNIGYCVV